MTSLHRYLLLAGLMVIFLFALLPGQLTPAYIVNHDKGAHALAFFVLSLMLAGAFPLSGLRFRLLVLILLALSIEAMQFLFVGRGFSGEDLLFDAIGVFLFWVVVESYRMVVGRLFKRDML